MRTTFQGAIKLIQNMGGAGSAFVRRESEAERELQRERTEILRRGQHELEEVESWCDGLRRKARDADSREEAAWQARHDARLERAAAAQEMRRRRLPSMVREFRDRRREELRGRQFYFQRIRDGEVGRLTGEKEAGLAEIESERSELTLERRAVRRALAGYVGAARLAVAREGVAAPSPFDREAAAAAVAEARGKLQKDGAAVFFRKLPPSIWIFLLVPLAAALMAPALSPKVSWAVAGGIGGLCAILMLGLGGAWLAGLAGVKKKALAFAKAANARESGLNAVETDLEKEAGAKVKEQEDLYAAEVKKVEEGMKDVEPDVKDYEVRLKERFATQFPRVELRLAAWLEDRLNFQRGGGSDLAGAEREIVRRRAEIQTVMDAGITGWEGKRSEVLGRLAREWHEETAPFLEELRAYRTAPELQAFDWEDPRFRAAEGVDTYAQALRFGLWTPAAPRDFPKDPVFALPEDAADPLPIALSLPGEGALYWETASSAGPEVVDTMQGVILRALLSLPPGKAAFTFFDPVGLGKNFAGLMHLADYEETLVNRRIWTQRDQFEERLAELSEHIEKVIQMYLRDDYATITEYNEKAGVVAEKYYFLVIADYPAQFSETAAARLRGILTSGPRCGVFTMIHRDTRAAAPEDFGAAEFRSSCVHLRETGASLAVCSANQPVAGKTELEMLPKTIDYAGLVHEIGQRSVDSNRVELPFSYIAPKPDQVWTYSAAEELQSPIGRTGATKLQMLSMGKGTRQHALVAGKTGSGKSTLFHVIITNLALRCSPEEVEFYLIDFKKGVEFKCYADKKLPHARVIAIESDREFGLSVLRRVDEELKRRGDLFRKLGVQDLAGYRKLSGVEPMARSLLLIDEFQEFFVDDDQVAQAASLLFDRIVRQGRAFGVHALLGSQTLGGSYSLPRSTLGQMVIRIALQTNEADAHLIMDENNSAPRLLTRPGEGIYNDAAGALEGNSPFQVCWISDGERDARLEELRLKANAEPDRYRRPVVFEGNAPADPSENSDLLRLLTSPLKNPVAAPRCDLGAPNSIKGPANVVFHRQSGANLLIVSQVEERSRAMIANCLMSLAAQFAGGSPRVDLLLGGGPESQERSYWEMLLEILPGDFRPVEPADLPAGLSAMGEELSRREAGAVGPSVFFVAPGAHRYKVLRPDEDFSFSFDENAAGGEKPAAILERLIKDGPAQGIHVIVSTDGFSNVTRGLGRKLLTEMSMRVLFQMSANDSASLMDSPIAANLGPHRAALYHEQEGAVEVFRPYFELEEPWLREVFAKRD